MAVSSRSRKTTVAFAFVLLAMCGFAGCTTAPSHSSAQPRKASTPNEVQAVVATPVWQGSVEELGPFLRKITLVSAHEANARGDFATALRESEEALAVNPRNVEALHIRVRARLGLNQFENALADAQKALELDPSANSCNYLASALYHAGHMREAITVAKQGLALPGDDRVRHDLHFAKAAAHARLLEWDEVLIETEDGLALDPQDARLHVNRALAFNGLGDPSAALPHAEFAVTHLPSDPLPLETRGLSYFLLERFDAAWADLDRAQTRPQPPGALDRQRIVERWTVQYAMVAMEKGMREGWSVAVADFDRVIPLLESRKVEPWSLYSSRAEAKRDLGDRAGAIADWAIGTRLNPRVPGPFRSMGECFGQLGNWEAAENAFETAASLDANPESYDLLFATVARLHRGTNNPAAKLQLNLPHRPDGWGKTVARFLVGEIDEAALFAHSAQGESAEKIREQTCEACFYAGVRRLHGGEAQTAADLFERSIATGLTAFTEYTWAVAELDHLRTTTRQP